MVDYELNAWQWALACLGAALMGLSKTGVPGIGIFTVAIFALLFPAREASGIVLPFLIAADLVAVRAYHHHAQWKYLWRLFPPALAGIALGTWTMGRIDSGAVSKLVGVILLAVVVLHLWRKKHAGEEVPTSPLFVASTGVSGGFFTMVANAAGPIMTMFLLAMRLPKMNFMGTMAWYFLILNVVKVPFSVHLGLINARSLALDVPLALCAVAGALGGRRLLPRINQAAFEAMALAFTTLAALKLIF
jgi:uncharacterized membrane protein YfcA